MAKRIRTYQPAEEVDWKTKPATASKEPGQTAEAAGHMDGRLSARQQAVLSMQRGAGNSAVRRMLRPLVGAPMSRPVTNAALPPEYAYEQPKEPEETSDEPAAGPAVERDKNTPNAPLQRKIGDGHDLTSPRFAGDPVLEAAFDNERLVSVGSSGPHVAKLQQALVDLGFPLPKFGVDSKFGSETQRAVKDFQGKNGLKDDGLVGPLTMGKFDTLAGGAPGPTPPGPTPPGPTPPGPTPPGPTPPAPVNVPITITGKDELWFFNNAKPTGYPLQQALTASSGGVAGSFKWSINTGAGFADFKGAPTAVGQIATLASKLQSGAKDDIEIKVDFTGSTGQTGTATKKFTVLAPDSLKFLRNVDKVDATFAYETEIHYSILDQFATVLPRTVSVNEHFTATPTADFAGMDWRRGAEGNANVNPADWFDQVQGETADKTPTPVGPGAPDAGVAVYHWPGRWQVGSNTIDKGKSVKSLTWSKSKGLARHT